MDNYSKFTEKRLSRRNATTIAVTFTDDKVEIWRKSYDGNGGQKPDVKVARNT